MWVCILVPVLLLLMQLIRPAALNPALFFLSGGLLLAGLLLAFRKFLFRTDTGSSGKIQAGTTFNAEPCPEQEPVTYCRYPVCTWNLPCGLNRFQQARPVCQCTG
jgi:hypothetical protein